MIASADLFVFKSQEKQRVADYFKAHPTGDYNHFQDTWKRSAQVSRGIFDEVYTRLQKSGAIRMIEGGRAHELLAKEIEARLIKEGKLSARQAEPEPVPEAPPAPTPAKSIPVQAPLNFPNAVPEPTTTKEDEIMAKEYGIRQLSPEQRKLLDKTFAARPDIGYEDLNAILGITLKKTVYTATKVVVKKGDWHFTHLDGVRAPSPMTRVSSGHSNGHIPLVNYTKISSPQIIGSIETQGYSAAEIKFIATKLPSILAELLDRRFSFKVYKYSEYEGEQEVERLEFRRVQ